MPRGLHGRSFEVAAIQQGLDAARAGRSAAFALMGEPGIGKTRLTAEIADRAAAAGFTVCWGRAWEAGGAPPYWPWRLLFESMPAVSADGPLAQVWGRRSGGPAVDPEQARFELFDAAAAAIRDAAARAPLLCVLDDLHAADAASLELAAFTTRDRRLGHVLWLLTWRDAEAQRAPVADLIARIACEASVLPLERLHGQDANGLIDEVRADTPPAVREGLIRATGGNPLFLLETLACLRDGDGHDLARLPLAQGVGAVVRQRLALLGPQLLPLLEAAALIGRDVSLVRWAAAAGVPGDSLAAGARDIVASGILSQTAGDRWRFSHEVVREVIERAVPPDRAAAAHRRIAELLDREVDAGDASATGERAHHALLAGGQLPARTVIGWVIAAADHLRVQGAFETAVDLLETSAAQLGPAAAADASLQLARGRAQADKGNTRAARAAFESAIELGRAAGDARTVACGVLGSGSQFVYGDIRADLVARIDEAAAALDAGSGDLQARLLARKAAALTPPARPDEVLAMARRALQLAADVVDPDAQLEVAVSVTSTFGEFAHPRERLPVNERIIRLARDGGDRVLELRGLSNLVIDHIRLAQLHQAEPLLRRRDELARALKLPRFAWTEPLFRSMCSMAAGRFDECDASIAEAEGFVATADDPNVARTIARHRTWFLLVADRPEALRAYEATALEALRVMPPILTTALQAITSLRVGDAAEARRQLDSLDPALPHAAINALATLGEVAAAVESPLRQPIYDRLLPHADCYAVWGLPGLTCGPPVAATLGLLAASLGDRGSAAAHFEAALAITRDPRAQALARWTQTWRDRALGRTPGETTSQTTAPAPAAAAPAPLATLRPQAGAWLLETASGQFLLPELRGMAMLAGLLARPDEEIHALELVSGVPGPGADRGDAGELIDETARADYRRRLAELAATVESAEARGDAAAAEAAQDEREAIQSELARAIGRDGRMRRAGVAAERARITAQRRIREAIRKIGEVDRTTGERLDRAVRTGNFCVYRSRTK